MYKSLPLLIFILASLANLPDEDAVVTFYSNGSYASSGFPGSKHGIFRGLLYDGNEKLASIGRRHFLTVRATPGDHVYSASYEGHPAKNSHLPLHLLPGQHYFIRAESESQGVVIIEFEKGRLDSVTCEIAYAEAGNTKPVKEKAVAKAVRSRIVVGESIPPCS